MPRYARRGFAFKVAIGLLGIASSVLAHIGMLDLVVLTTAAATALLSCVTLHQQLGPATVSWPSADRTHLHTHLHSTHTHTHTHYTADRTHLTFALAPLTIGRWGEFSDVASKTERYSRAVGALNDLLDWWTSLSDVEKASREAAEKLTRTAEGILADERSWQKVGNTDPGSSNGDAAAGDDGDDKEELAERARAGAGANRGARTSKLVSWP